jgi:OOP family OmpA-OmpF porin
MVHRSRAWLGALVALAVWFVALGASAQQNTFYLDRAQISGAPDDGFMVWRPNLHDRTRFYGMATLGYTLNPLRDATVTDDPGDQRQMGNIVAGQFITYLNGGVEISDRVGVNIGIPIAVYQYGEDDFYGINPIDTAPVMLHDIRLDARLRIFTSDSGKFQFGAFGAGFIPSGEEKSFGGDEEATWLIGLNAEYDFDTFLLAGMIGPHFRPWRGIDRTGGTQYLSLASELRYGVGGYLPLRDDKIRLGLELWGTAGVGDAGGQDTTFGSRNTDLEWLAQGRFLLGKTRQTWVMAGAGTRLSGGYGAPDLRILVSIGYWFGIKDTSPGAPARMWRAPPEVEDQESDRDGDGFPDNIDKCPDVPEDGKDPDPSDGCPVGADRDNDGIPDNVDHCPDDPEDKDGVEDQDGCPETDADNDDIPDTEDKCPTEPGPASEIAEKHGCPSLTRIEEDGTIALLEPIQFETAKATIKKVSFPILDEVVTLMKARPNLRIGVYGHTDSRGGDAYNMRLSKQRAASCVHYIVGKGIARNRLESEGFGETQPIDTNDTPEGRAKNRRTEFKMLNAEAMEND